MFRNLKITKILTSLFDIISLILTSVAGYIRLARFLINEKIFKNFSIKTKLISTFFLVGILSIIITGGLCYLHSKNTLEEVYTEKLASIRETKKQQIETYFNQIRNQAITLSENHMIINAMNQFKAAVYDIKNDNAITDSKISQYKSDLRDYYENEYLARLNLGANDKKKIEQYFPENEETIILQYHYIANNLNPTGSKDNLEMAADGSKYSQIHSKYHTVIRDYQKKFGYYDIFLVDAQTGNIVYSVFKEVDFATNLFTGPYKDTNFARVFKEAQNAPENKFSKLIDFESYTPSYEDPASFIASPIFDGERKIGVLIFQVPINEINRVMTGNYNWKNEGLGESGETYIVGSGYGMKNDSRFFIEEPDRYFELLDEIGTDKQIINQIKSHSTSTMFQKIRTEAAKDALKGNTNTKIIDDYRDISVLSSYTPLNIADVTWVILSEIDKDEAFASLYATRDIIFLIAVIISVLVTIIAFSISDNIAEPILRLAIGTKNIARGDFSKKIITTQKDEIGVLSDSFNRMTEKLIEANVNKDQALIESKRAREYSENLIETAHDAIVGINENRMVCIWNKAAEKIFRYTKSDIIGNKIYTIFPGETIDSYLAASMFLNLAKIMELSGKRKDGTSIPIEMSISSQNSVDKGNSFTLIIRDITEKKKSENEIQKLSRAVEQSPCTIVITDYDGIIEYANPRFVQLTGYTINECLGENPSVLKSGETPPELYKELWDTIKSGKEWHGEFLNKKKNGELFWESASISPVKNNEGAITHFIAVKEDITKQKRISDELQKSEQSLNEAQHLAKIGSWEYNFENKQTKWSKEQYLIYGFESDGLELTFDNIVNIVHPDDRKSFVEGNRCCIESRKPYSDEYRIIRPDSSEVYISSQTKLIKDSTGKLISMVGTVQDITERKEMELQLVHAQKLESIGQLAAGVAHEINTPTQYILDNTNFLQDAFKDINKLLEKYSQLYEMSKSGPVTPELTAEIDAAAGEADVDYLIEEIPNAINQSLEGLDRVKNIVYAMKNFSHPDNENKKPIDINEAIRNTITVASNEWKYVAEVETDFDSNLTTVPCFPGDFNQIILNLIVNAAHAIDGVPENGSDAKGIINIITRSDGDWAEIRVSDTGTGIPEDIKARIFDPFFTTKEVGKGTGQGLSLVHSSVVGKHNGTITLDSEIGKGTTFILRLPLSSSLADNVDS